jgi:hypothetical protein
LCGEVKLTVISDFRRSVCEICALLGFYAALSEKSISPVFINQAAHKTALPLQTGRLRKRYKKNENKLHTGGLLF